MKNLLLAVLAVLAIVPMASAQELPWITVPEKAFALAHETGKPIFADSFAKWCSWCVKLDKETFSDASFIKVSEKFVLLKVDGDVYPEFRKKYDARYYPTLLFLNADGKEIHDRIVGFAKPERLVPIMEKLAGQREMPRVYWHTDPAKALEASVDEKKPVFVDVWMAGCSYCDKLDKETFSRPDFQMESAKFVLLKVFRTDHPNFIAQYQIKGYPSMLFLNGEGKEISDRLVGFRSADVLIPIMRKVAASYPQTRSLNWFEDPEMALAKAKEEGKPVFVDVWMQGCYYCDKLEKETFPRPDFQEESKRFILLKVFKNSYPTFLQKYQIQGYPTMLFLNGDGREIHSRILGFRTADVLVPIMKKVAVAPHR